MPLYKPELSPRVHPYGGLKDITPEDMEALFLSSKGGNPAVAPFNYKFRVPGRYKLQVWFGRTAFPKTLHLFTSEDGGEQWERKDSDFPALLLIDADNCFIESPLESNTLYLQAPMQIMGGPEHESIELYRSEDNGETWDHERSLSVPGYTFIGHRHFVWSEDVYQVACVIADTGPPFDTKVAGWKNGDLVVFETTTPLVSNGGLSDSVNSLYYETAFFNVEFNSLFGGQAIWRVTPGGGIEFRSKLPESPFSIPATPTRPFIQQMWYLPKKGILYLPTLIGTGHRVYTSFDDGLTWSEEEGGIRIMAPQLNTVAQTGLFEDPVTGQKYKNFEFMQNLTDANNWSEILQGYAGDDSLEWHIAFQSRLFRRGSRFYLWELLTP